MRRKFTLILSAIVGGITCFVASCAKDPDPDAAPGSVSFYVPEGWPQPVYDFTSNTLTREGFDLGRRIFFDTRLSRDNSTSCGSCHQPFAAFAQTEHRVSHGVGGLLGTRNSPGLYNLAWHPNFMWDGGINHIELQPLAPITNPVEMGETLDNVLARLNADEDYKKRFEDAFGSSEITSQLLFRAMAQFMAAMISDNSKWDKVQRGAETFTEEEARGQQLFTANCASCHQPPLFSDFSFRNNGLPPSSLNDEGRAVITHDDADKYLFKVPSLRNAGFTGPYMHDGRFTTLEAVLEHYHSGIAPSATLDTSLIAGIQMNPSERKDMIAFLHTLSDSTFVHDSRFAE